MRFPTPAPIDNFVALWRFMAPTQRRLLGVTWTCCSLGFVFPMVDSLWFRVPAMLAFLGCLAYCLKILKDVREEVDEAARMRGEAEMGDPSDK